MNISDLPNDIHYTIINNIKNGEDLVNLKDSCKKLKKLFYKEVEILKVDLFKIDINFEFKQFDLKKHEMICRKFSKFKEEFFNGYIHFNRTTNNSIFDTTTMIYISLYIDDLKSFELKFLEFLKKYNINKHINCEILTITLNLLFGNELFDFVKLDNFNSNRNDIIVDYKTKLNVSNIFSIYNDLEYYQWKNLDKILGLKFKYIMTYNLKSIYHSCYIVVHKKDLKSYINILIENCKNIMTKIDKDINYFAQNNYTMSLIENLNENYYNYENKLFNLINNKLKLFLKRDINLRMN